MKLTIDTDASRLILEEHGVAREIALYSKDAFEAVSRQWVRIGWNQKYPYTFSWLGRPIIQLPEDMIRAQEVICRLKPDVIIETGIAHGGSLIYYASLCRIMGKGRVIGVDADIRPRNRKAIEKHPLSPYITLVEGNSVAPEVVARVGKLLEPGESVMVILDSDHTKQHVLAELNAYGGFVTRGAYIVATDGIMEDLGDVPRGKPDWRWNNPAAAVEEFLKGGKGFVLEQPSWPFNKSPLSENVTHWPRAWLKKR